MSEKKERERVERKGKAFRLRSVKRKAVGEDAGKGRQIVFDVDDDIGGKGILEDLDRVESGNTVGT